MTKTKNIAVIGSGYTGTTTAAVLANCGYNVVAIDVDKKKVDKINRGLSPFFEQGLDALLTKAIKNRTLTATTSYEKLATADVVFSCVGTPDNPDGSSNLAYVFDAAKSSIKFMRPNTIFVQKSTVPVGTGKRVEELFAKAGKTIHYVSNPEFLREGTAIADTLYFDRLVAGGRRKEAVEQVLDLYRSVEKRSKNIANLANSPCSIDYPGNYIVTNLNSAELIKVTANAFLALKISFANSIAKLADHTDADVNEVMDAVGADRRIGRAFLNAGRGYGGGCFPKDVSGLISTAGEYGVDLQIMTEAAELNASMPGYIANKVKTILGNLEHKRLAVLGLSYKVGTSDTRLSPGVRMANILARDGASVCAFDPHANGEAKESLRRGIKVCPSMEAAVENVDGVLVSTDWPEFIKMDLAHLAKLMTGKLFVDCMNAFTISSVEAAGLLYTGVGRSGTKK